MPDTRPDTLLTDADDIEAAAGGMTRRELFQIGNVLALPVLLGSARAEAAAAAGPLKPGPEIYQSIGVEPIINARGTFTIIGGSVERPEVRAAMDAASRYYVQMDELADAVGQRLSELTGAEWGMVSAGCAAGLKHVTAACVTGGNPEKLTRIPDLTGFDKTEVVIPRYSRNVYDAAVRNIGVTVITVETPEELSTALNPRTAMIYLTSGGGAYESGPLSLEAIAAIAQPRSVPILVDAAAEILTIPNVHLQRGATIVAYSGGKAICGPQCAGLLLGRKDILMSAWQASAPHHGPGRDNKVGREETLGMVAAVEAWVKRDHPAEWKTWLSWLDHISRRVSTVAGVKTTVREPAGLNNKSPSLVISWDPAQLNITGEEVAEELAKTKPRIALGGGGGGGRGAQPDPNTTSVGVTAWMMQPGDDKGGRRASSQRALAQAGGEVDDAGVAGCEHQRPMGRGDRLLQQQGAAHALRRAGWQLAARIAPGRIHRARHGGHDRRRSGQDSQRGTAAGKLCDVHLRRHVGRRHDLRPDLPG